MFEITCLICYLPYTLEPGILCFQWKQCLIYALEPWNQNMLSTTVKIKYASNTTAFILFQCQSQCYSAVNANKITKFRHCEICIFVLLWAIYYVSFSTGCKSGPLVTVITVTKRLVMSHWWSKQHRTIGEQSDKLLSFFQRDQWTLHWSDSDIPGAYFSHHMASRETAMASLYHVSSLASRRYDQEVWALGCMCWSTLSPLTGNPILTKSSGRRQHPQLETAAVSLGTRVWSWYITSVLQTL